jgi:hypothetical protein
VHFWVWGWLEGQIFSRRGVLAFSGNKSYEGSFCRKEEQWGGNLNHQNSALNQNQGETPSDLHQKLFTPKFLFVDSFPIPALVLGHESLLILPTNYPLYLSLLYTATIAFIMILVFSIPALLIKPLLRMPEYEYFHDAWARVKFLFTKSSWKKRLTIIFIITILIIIYLIIILFYMGIFQILHLTYTDTLILLFTALPPLLLLFWA